MDDIRWAGRLAIARKAWASAYYWMRKVAFVLLSAILEKNPTKLLATEAPIVFSATRVVVVGFAVVMIRRLWLPGGIGWPEVTLSAVIAIALPLVSALQALAPADVVAFANQIVQKFGSGDTAPAGRGGDR